MDGIQVSGTCGESSILSSPTIIVSGNQNPVCKKCGETDRNRFLTRNAGGRRYFRHLCKGCFDGCRSKLDKGNRDRRTNTYHQRNRANGVNLAYYVLQDSRRSDKKKGLEWELDREFVQELLTKPCSYCGETAERMTLDRIDNTKGHVRTNVVGACIRCNYVRGAMPYDAWVVVAEGMRKARERGLFEKWTWRCR